MVPDSQPSAPTMLTGDAAFAPACASEMQVTSTRKRSCPHLLENLCRNKSFGLRRKQVKLGFSRAFHHAAPSHTISPEASSTTFAPPDSFFAKGPAHLATNSALCSPGAPSPSLLLALPLPSGWGDLLTWDGMLTLLYHIPGKGSFCHHREGTPLMICPTHPHQFASLRSRLKGKADAR